ncbi:MAG TPA: ATP-binding protein [Gemmatimonadaceae bacterium]|nr:ATP-binding protein [Gemmatimonadaceae bacterium]
MAQPNGTRGAPAAAARRVARELRRYAWTSAAALMAIAITVALSAPTIAIVLVCIEVLLVLVALQAFTQRIVGQAHAIEDQQARLESQTREARLHAHQKAQLASLLDTALQNAPVGFAFFDRDLRFLRANERLSRLHGIAPEDYIGTTLREIDPIAADEVEPLLRQVLETGVPVVGAELDRVTANRAETRHLISSFYPIATREGELFAIGAVAADVTEWRRLEAQFRQAQKMEAVGRLAGGVAHDFNNLLTVISSYAELLMTDPDEPDAREAVAEIRGATARAAKLTRQLLAFSRGQELRPRVVNPNDVLRGLETLTRRVVVNHVEIRNQLAPDVPLVRVDPGQLEQVVMNLAINAADAMPDGGVLTIETGAAELGPEVARRDPDVTPGQYALIRVSDTGIGMDEVTISRIFEPFFTTKEPGRGTGLGLSTVYGIVKQSGGLVDVESAPGAGSTFLVYLPAVAD